MNKDILAGKWEEFKGKVISEWGKLTLDDVEECKGDMVHLSGKLREMYGWTEEEAKEEMKKIEKYRKEMED